MNAYETWLKKAERREPSAGMLVWPLEGALSNRLCVVVSVSSDRAMIRSLSSGRLTWIEKNALDTDTIIE
jgi:hypothetical protein